jgi:hypothetical protein
MQYILYVLLFIFGYITCRTFYFLRAVRLSISLIVSGHLVYLSAIERIIKRWEQNLEEANLEKNDRISRQFKLDREIETLQSTSINYLLRLHPSFYRHALKFHDWSSAMAYLEQNRDLMNEFWQEEKS